MFIAHNKFYTHSTQILARVAPAVAVSESNSKVHSPLMQLLRLAWGYKEVNDGHLHEVSHEGVPTLIIDWCVHYEIAPREYSLEIQCLCDVAGSDYCACFHDNYVLPFR